ncbi:MAG TPA: autotransporter-associated beta strand repeat-containing protein [Verrucomicrobiae bacterium]|nr:autotransporter-associated beta strand repeat-containing protein [Verrucomicrobiae bacterium]
MKCIPEYPCPRPGRKLLSSLAAVAAFTQVFSASAGTVAYWRFEGDGVNTPVAGVTQVEDTDERTTTATGVGIRVVDVSGNGNTVWAWQHDFAGATYASTVPAATIPLTGSPNNFSTMNAGSFPALFTWSAQSAPSVDLETIKPLQWTIEASIRSTDNTGHRTFVGRDGNGVSAGGSAAPLYFKHFDGTLRVEFADEAGNFYTVSDSTGTLALDTWYNVAVVSDGTRVKLYKDSGAGYQLVGNMILTPGDTRLAYDDAGSTTAGDAQWGWTIGRGRYGTSDLQSDNHVDRWFGGIDEVRISDSALKPSQFLFAPTNVYVISGPVPASQTVALGSPASFAIEAGGQNPAYQWRLNGTNISGANSEGYTINSVGAQHVGSYDVVISNSGSSRTSSVATLSIHLPRNVQWAGVGNVWNTSSASWTTNSGANLISYVDTDHVTFGTLGTVQSAISVEGTRTPGSMVVSAGNYSLSGGSIGGNGSLTIESAGALVLGTTNSYSGNTMINGGRLQAGIASAIPDGLGAGNVTIAAGGVLDLAGFADTINGLSGAGVITNSSTNSAVLTVGNSGAALNWAGSIADTTAGHVALIKAGTNQSTISGINRLNGTAANQINGGIATITGSLLMPAGEFWIAEGPVTASVTLNGGTIAASNNWFVVGRNSSAANGKLTVNSGLVVKGGNGNFVVGSLGATGELIVNGGTVLNNANLWLGEGATANATLRLNGGLVQANQIRPNGAFATSVAYFNGGTLQASGSSADFIVSTTPYIQTGGLVFDNNGFDVTIASISLQEDGASPGGGLRKIGTGTLALNSGATYSGPTVVTAGTLSVSPALTFYTATAVTVSNATLQIDASGGSASYSANSLTLQNNAVLQIGYGTVTGNPAIPALSVAGGISAPGTGIKINITGVGLQIGQFPLISHNGAPLPNLANITLGSVPPGVTASLVNNTGSGTIDLNVTATGQNLSWYGSVNGNWDINASANWFDGFSTTARYLEYGSIGDPVRFDDTLFNDFVNPPRTNIALATTVRPFTVVADSTHPYRIFGSGGIAGAASIIKSNTGSLTLNTVNSYTGGTFIRGGALVVNSDAALGSASGGITLGGGSLRFTENATSLRPITMAAESAFFVDAGRTVQYGGVISGNSRLNFDGAGTKILTNRGNVLVHIKNGSLVLEGDARYTNTTWTAIAPYYNSDYESVSASLVLRGNATFDTGNNDFNVSDSTLAGGGDNGRLDIQDNAILRFRNLWIGKGLNATGMVYQTGGVWTNHYGPNADLRIGGNAADQVDTFGRYQISGGRADFRRLLQVGAYGIGELLVSGGQFNNNASVVIGRFPGSRGTVAVTGGQFNQLGSGNVVIVGENGTGTFQVGGTGVATLAGALNVGGFGTPGTGTVHLATGGLLITPQVRMGSALGTSTFNFDGGTLMASGPSATFMQGLNIANVLAGGARIDSSTNNITIAQALLNAGGNGGLTKLGSGTLLLKGANTYSGLTTVTAGTLLVTPLHQIPAGAVSVADGATFGVAGDSAAKIGNLTLGSGGATTLSIVLTGATNPAAAVLEAGVITINGISTVRLGGTFTAGTFPIVKYTGALSGSFNATVASSQQGFSGILSNHVAGSTLYAVVLNAGTGLVWTGTNAAPGLANRWDIDSTVNWLAGSTPVKYQEPVVPGDSVVFNDLGSGLVLLSNVVSPSSVMVSNQSVGYSIAGSGRISGVAGFGKRGTGTVTNALAGNDYQGNTVISEGTLQLGSATAVPDGIGAGNVVVNTNAVLELAGFGETINGLSGAGKVNNFTGTPILTVGGANASSTWDGTMDWTAGGLRLIKVGTGTLTLTATNRLNGANNQVNGGSVIVSTNSELNITGGDLWIAEGANAGSMTVNNGVVKVSNWVVIGRNNVAADGTLTINGGNFSKTTTSGSFVIASLGAKGRLVINGGQVLNPSQLWLGENATADAELHLNGGLLQAAQLRHNGTAGVNQTAYFNGGTLQASAASTDFIQAPVVPVIRSGGLTLDSQSFAISILAGFTEDATSMGGGLTKTGSGTVYMNGPNSYSGLTHVANGTLAGSGSIAGPVTVGASGTIAAGDGTLSMGVLTLNGSTLTLHGNAGFRVSKDGGSPISDQIVGIGSAQYGGFLTISNATSDGTPLVLGDTFTLFSSGAGAGNFAAVLGSAGPGLGFSFNPANGTVTVVTAAPTGPTNITASRSGNTLTLSWPSTHLGWVLQSQTNALSTGLSINWHDIAGSASSTQAVLNINSLDPAVFYRLRQP